MADLCYMVMKITFVSHNSIGHLFENGLSNRWVRRYERRRKATLVQLLA